MAIKRLFSDWDKEALEATFGLTRCRSLPALDAWLRLAETQVIEDAERVLLRRLQEVLIDQADAWNETELTEYFIGQILAFVNFHTAELNIFSERALTGVIGDYELSGEPDAIIAKGRYSPQIPYFCFHEYKRAYEPKGDPAAQALAAMLVARELNPKPHPMYGMYVVAEKWHFMALQDREYAISQGFLADDEIFDIFNILKALKAILIEIVRQDASSDGDSSPERRFQGGRKI